jgi:1-deoxy-D-xylulose-5-phosphate synthase
MTRHDRHQRLKMIGVQDEFVHQGTVAELYERCGMDAASLERLIEELVKS